MTDPVPTKFEDGEWYAIQLLSYKSGISSKSEIIRRCVRLLAEEVRKNPDWNWVEDTARLLPAEEYAAMLTAAGKPPVSMKIPGAPTTGATKAKRRKTG